ncbi:MAG: hypothetical protein ACD_47C00431G0001 [uncultured bacterium]|nr:MAG: hypothetical protein ACD_47C00431G0001 [uncultured bacterium]
MLGVSSHAARVAERFLVLRVYYIGENGGDLFEQIRTQEHFIIRQRVEYAVDDDRDARADFDLREKIVFFESFEKQRDHL